MSLDKVRLKKPILSQVTDCSYTEDKNEHNLPESGQR
jgi:hypothetical protein